MTIKDFFESEVKIAIHCNTEEKAKKLLEAFDKAGYCWAFGGKYSKIILWDVHGKDSCYSNRKGYYDIDYYKSQQFQIFEFEEIELEDTIKVGDDTK